MSTMTLGQFQGIIDEIILSKVNLSYFNPIPNWGPCPNWSPVYSLFLKLKSVLNFGQIRYLLSSKNRTLGQTWKRIKSEIKSNLKSNRTWNWSNLKSNRMWNQIECEIKSIVKSSRMWNRIESVIESEMKDESWIRYSIIWFILHWMISCKICFLPILYGVKLQENICQCDIQKNFQR